VKDLAATQPERVTELGMHLEQHLKENKAVIPRLNPDFSDKRTP
jgi:hypothetical protein